MCQAGYAHDAETRQRGAPRRDECAQTTVLRWARSQSKCRVGVTRRAEYTLPNQAPRCARSDVPDLARAYAEKTIASRGSMRRRCVRPATTAADALVAEHARVRRVRLRQARCVLLTDSVLDSISKIPGQPILRR